MAPEIIASSGLPELLGLSDRLLILQDGRQATLIDRESLTVAHLLARFDISNAA